MNPDLSRTLTVLADGEKVSGFARARLTGREAAGLLPLPFFLTLWNLKETDAAALSAAKTLSVLHGEKLLAWGQAASVFRRRVPEGTVTEVSFSPGLSLWEARVSLPVEAGVPVSETVRRILAASGTGIPLLGFPGRDPVSSRGQAYFGRAAECVSEALSAAGAAGVVVPSGLCVLPSSGIPVSECLSGEDLTDKPVPAGAGWVLRTRPVGWPVGKGIRFPVRGGERTGVILERAVDADSASGPWQAELVVSEMREGEALSTAGGGSFDRAEVSRNE